MEDNELHDVVRLLLARMESHPEEFGGNDPRDEYIHRGENDRWWQAHTLVAEHGTDEEKAALRAAMRKIKLKVAHEWMMDELLNGDERRAKYREEEAAYERNLILKQSLAQQQVVQQQMTQVLNTQQLQTVIDTYVPEPWENNGLVATIRKGLGIK